LPPKISHNLFLPPPTCELHLVKIFAHKWHSNLFFSYFQHKLRDTHKKIPLNHPLVISNMQFDPWSWVENHDEQSPLLHIIFYTHPLDNISHPTFVSIIKNELFIQFFASQFLHQKFGGLDLHNAIHACKLE
jgi:hypothetical protein